MLKYTGIQNRTTRDYSSMWFTDIQTCGNTWQHVIWHDMLHWEKQSGSHLIQKTNQVGHRWPISWLLFHTRFGNRNCSRRYAATWWLSIQPSINSKAYYRQHIWKCKTTRQSMKRKSQWCYQLLPVAKMSNNNPRQWNAHFTLRWQDKFSIHLWANTLYGCWYHSHKKEIVWKRTIAYCLIIILLVPGPPKVHKLCALVHSRLWNSV